VARFGFGQSIGQGAGKELAFRVFQRVAGVAELTGRVKEFGIAHPLGCPSLEIVEGAPGQ
jgi:hypothetical protein